MAITHSDNTPPEFDPSQKEMASVDEATPKDESDNGSSDMYIDPVKEARMMRKFDVRIMFPSLRSFQSYDN